MMTDCEGLFSDYTIKSDGLSIILTINNGYIVEMSRSDFLSHDIRRGDYLRFRGSRLVYQDLQERFKNATQITAEVFEV